MESKEEQTPSNPDSAKPVKDNMADRAYLKDLGFVRDTSRAGQSFVMPFRKTGAGTKSSSDSKDLPKDPTT